MAKSNSKIDELFLKTTEGNAEAKEQLSTEFLKLAKLTANSILNKYNIRNVSLDDLEDCFLDIYMQILEDYKPSKQCFSVYLDFVLKKRIQSYMHETCFKRNRRWTSLDSTDSEGQSLKDVIEDKSIVPIPESYSIESLKLKMCSPKHTDNKTEKLMKKVAYLLFEGYSYKEIEEELNLSRSQVRYLRKKIIEQNADQLNTLELH